MTKIIQDLSAYGTLTPSLVVSLRFLLDNHKTIDTIEMQDVLLSLINQLELNHFAFNLILDKINKIQSDS